MGIFLPAALARRASMCGHSGLAYELLCKSLAAWLDVVYILRLSEYQVSSRLAYSYWP